MIGADEITIYDRYGNAAMIFSGDDREEKRRKTLKKLENLGFTVDGNQIANASQELISQAYWTNKAPENLPSKGRAAAQAFNEKVRDAAREIYAQGSDDDIEIDDGAEVTSSEDGFWVVAQVYVRNEDVGLPSIHDEEGEEA
jgi:hypothetical protein